MADQRDPDELCIGSPMFGDEQLVVLVERRRGLWALTVGWSGPDGPRIDGFCGLFDLPGSMSREEVHGMARMYLRVFSKGLSLTMEGVANG